MHWKITRKKSEQLSPNFKSEEFVCKCGSCPASFVSERLLGLLEEIRLYFNEPVRINSGYRCPEHNRNVGGSENSRHTHGEAADIIVKNTLPREIASFLDKRFPRELGIGNYAAFTHVDVRDYKARWGD